jgi:hypothetical protein
MDFRARQQIRRAHVCSRRVSADREDETRHRAVAPQHTPDSRARTISRDSGGRGIRHDRQEMQLKKRLKRLCTSSKSRNGFNLTRAIAHLLISGNEHCLIDQQTMRHGRANPTRDSPDGICGVQRRGRKNSRKVREMSRLTRPMGDCPDGNITESKPVSTRGLASGATQ